MSLSRWMSRWICFNTDRTLEQDISFTERPLKGLRVLWDASLSAPPHRPWCPLPSDSRHEPNLGKVTTLLRLHVSLCSATFAGVAVRFCPSTGQLERKPSIDSKIVGYSFCRKSMRLGDDEERESATIRHPTRSTVASQLSVCS